MVRLFLFVLGGCVGSMVLCVSERYLDNRGFIFARSCCNNCKHHLAPYEIIPIFSYLIQKGRCLKCGYHIPIAYPLFELFCGLLYASFPVNRVLVDGLLSLLLLLIVVIDYKAYIIPDFLVFALMVNWLLINLMIKNRLCLGLISGLFIGFIVIASAMALKILKGRESMGGGDIKLLFALALYLTIEQDLIMLLMACVFGLLEMLLRKKEMIAFGPYICLSFMLIYFVQ